jgi:hypothetical protein
MSFLSKGRRHNPPCCGQAVQLLECPQSTAKRNNCKKKKENWFGKI